MDRLDDQPAADLWATVLRDLLMTLPVWSLVAQRKAFVEAALGGHPAAAELTWDDAPSTVAGNLAQRLAFFAAKRVN
ncbi:MAG: hypothetical protein LJE70_12570, partial [Chromatiaceae bacterium]|nr:hypothetical protein [Chromatiaceae bacterium]